MAAAQTVAERLDRLALAEHKKVTRAFAAKVLKELNAGIDGDGDGGGGGGEAGRFPSAPRLPQSARLTNV